MDWAGLWHHAAGAKVLKSNRLAVIFLASELAQSFCCFNELRLAW